MLAVGKTIGQVIQIMEIGEQTYYRWRNQYGGMKAEEAKRLKLLEEENKRLKKLLAVSELDKSILAESFFSRLRDEFLNVEDFRNLAEAKWFARRRLREHNEERPHSSLGYRTPAEFVAGLTSAQALQTGAAPPTIDAASTSDCRVQAEATAKANGARPKPYWTKENPTKITQPELSLDWYRNWGQITDQPHEQWGKGGFVSTAEITSPQHPKPPSHLQKRKA